MISRFGRAWSGAAVAVLIASTVVTAQFAQTYESLTVGASAVGLLDATRSRSNTHVTRCVAEAETAAMRFRLDSGTPSSTVGQPLAVGDVVVLGNVGDIDNFRAIRTTGASGALNFTCAIGTAEMPSMVIKATSGVDGVPNGGTGLTAVVTGDLLYASEANVLARLADVARESVLVSGGVGVAPTWNSTLALSGRLLVRESFDQPHIVLEEDFTAKVLTDAAINVVLGSPSGIVEFREEQAKTASSWVEVDGRLDISADNTTDNEGVEIYLGDDDDATTGWVVAGTTGLCFEVNFTITLIAGTDQFVIGWRQNEAFQDVAAYASYNDWSVVGINNVDGSVFSLREVNGAGTLSDDSGTNVANGGTYTLKSCITAAGLATASLDGVAITLTNGGALPHTAGDQLNPMISYLQAGGAVDAGVFINYWAITELP